MGIQANGILYFPNLWQKDSACAFSFSIFSFVWNKENIGCFKRGQLLQCYHRQKCKLHIHSLVNNMHWYLIFSCYITDRTVAVLICTFTSISFQWVHLYYRNVESQSFCNNIQIQNEQPPWNVSRFYFLHQIQKKNSIESNILKVRCVEAQQTLSVCSREENDRQFLNRTHIIYGQQYWVGELHTTTGCLPTQINSVSLRYKYFC